MIRDLLSNIVDYLRNPSGLPTDAARSINEELQFHLNESMHAGIDDGLSAEEARQQALERFGNVESAFRECAYKAAEGHVRCHRAHVAVTASLLLAVVTIGTWAYFRFSNNQDATLTGDIRGFVVDENSRPIDGAHVLAVIKTWPDDGFRQQAHTAVSRSDGTFVVEDVCPDQDDYEVQIAVLASGRVMDSSYFSRQRGPLAPTEFQLKPSAPLAVQIEGADGEPLNGVEVFPFQRVARDGVEDTVYFCSATPVTRRTDATGKVSLPYFSPGDNATVYLRIPGGEWDTRDFEVAEKEQLVVIRMTPATDSTELVTARPDTLK